jgi:hypothetical protein
MGLKAKSLTKDEIYRILLELFVYIKYNPKTKNDETVCDNMIGFLDCFVEEGIGYKILPNESIKRGS